MPHFPHWAEGCAQQKGRGHRCSAPCSCYTLPSSGDKGDLEPPHPHPHGALTPYCDHFHLALGRNREAMVCGGPERQPHMKGLAVH